MWGVASDEKSEVLTKISQIIKQNKKIHGDDVESSPTLGDVVRPSPNASF